MREATDNFVMGKCQYCGKTKILDLEDDQIMTLQEANIETTKTCDCEEARKAREAEEEIEWDGIGYGICQYCGQCVEVDAESDALTEEELNERASDTCDCKEGEYERNRKKWIREARERLEMVLNGVKNEEVWIWTPMEEDIREMAHELLDLMIAHKLRQATLVMCGEMLILKNTTSGIKVGRKRTESIEREIR